MTSPGCCGIDRRVDFLVCAHSTALFWVPVGVRWDIRVLKHVGSSAYRTCRSLPLHQDIQDFRVIRLMDDPLAERGTTSLRCIFLQHPLYNRCVVTMASHRALRGFLGFAMLSALAACSTVPTAARDILDEGTGASVTVVGAPITFSGQTSHNFLTLVAMQKDEQGKITTWLLLYRWYSYYGARQSASGADTEELLINVDGRSLDLKPLPALPAALPTAKDLFIPDKTAASLNAYSTDLETIRTIAMSHALTANLPNDPLGGSYVLDDDGRPALEQFVEHLSAR
jgi:hypothetical protein